MQSEKGWAVVCGMYGSNSSSVAREGGESADISLSNGFVAVWRANDGASERSRNRSGHYVDHEPSRACGIIISIRSMRSGRRLLILFPKKRGVAAATGRTDHYRWLDVLAGRRSEMPKFPIEFTTCSTTGLSTLVGYESRGTTVTRWLTGS